MAEEITGEPSAEQPIDQPQTDETSLPDPKPDDGDEGKPGGDDPQAVRARKEYQARKRVEAELANEREQRIRLEERTKALEEISKQGPKQAEERIFTIAEINAAVDAGQVSRADGDRYIEEKIFPAKINAALSQRDSKAREQEPVAAAGSYVDEYVGVMPALKDKSSAEFIKVATKYNELTSMGLPADFRTQKVALEMVHGTLTAQKERQQIALMNARARTIPTDGGSNGGGSTNSKTVDFSKAPESMVRMWNQTGTDQAARERQLKNYLAKQK